VLEHFCEFDIQDLGRDLQRLGEHRLEVWRVERPTAKADDGAATLATHAEPCNFVLIEG
jgi:hypothetical protein